MPIVLSELKELGPLIQRPLCFLFLGLNQRISPAKRKISALLSLFPSQWQSNYIQQQSAVDKTVSRQDQFSLSAFRQSN